MHGVVGSFCGNGKRKSFRVSICARVQLLVPGVCVLSVCVGPNDLPKYTISAYGKEFLREFVGIKISYHMLISFLIF